eukprot:15090375-Alexandrium_andersonii.AAC.1
MGGGGDEGALRVRSPSEAPECIVSKPAAEDALQVCSPAELRGRSSEVGARGSGRSSSAGRSS